MRDTFFLFVEGFVLVFLLALTGTGVLVLLSAAVDLFRKVMGG